MTTETAPGTPPNPGALVSRGLERYAEYQRTGETGPLAEAVALFRAASARTPAGTRGHAEYLNNLGFTLREWSARTGDASALEEAVRVCRDAVAATPGEHPSRGMHLANLGNALASLARRTGRTDVLGESIKAGQESVAALPPGHPDRASYLANLGVNLRLRYELTGDKTALEQAVQAARDAVAELPADHIGRASALANLCSALIVHYERTGESTALDGAIQAGRDAIAATPDDAVYRAGRLNNLAVALKLRYRRSGDLSVLDEALQAEQDAVAAVAADDPDRAGYLTNLGNSLELRAARLNNDADQVAAVRAAGEAVTATPVGDAARPSYLNNYGTALHALYFRTGDSRHLRDAAAALREAIAVVPPGHPAIASYQHNLGSVLLLIYEETGDAAVLDAAIQASRAAVAATPPGDPGLAGRLHGLSLHLQEKGRRDGDLPLLEEAVSSGQGAIGATAEGLPDRAVFLTSLCTGLRLLFGRTGHSPLLRAAVQAAKEAIAASQEGEFAYPGRLSHLGDVLHLEATRTGRLEPLGEAVRAYQRAVAATSTQRPERAIYLHNLSAALQTWAERTGDAAVLAEAVSASRESVAATPADHAARASRLRLLSRGLRSTSLRTGNHAVLDEAVEYGRAAVAAGDPGSADHVNELFDLAGTLRGKAVTDGDVALLREAEHLFRRVAEDEDVPPDMRIAAYRSIAWPADMPGADGASDLGPAANLAVLEAAVSLLPRVAPRFALRGDREHSIGLFAPFAAQVAAVAVAAGRDERAVELLEQARGLLMSDILDDRGGDLARLRDAEPAMADEFDRLRAKMNVDDPALVAERRAAVAMWEELVRRIRTIGSFTDFLKPPDIEQLARYAHDGPVIVVYSSVYRCDALVVSADDPDQPVRVVPLPQLTEAAADAQTRRLLAAVRAAEADGPPQTGPAQEILAVLGWAWDVIAGPVLEALGHNTAPAGGQAWPRVWWCPIGFLAYLPLHAAGHHDDLAAGREHPRTVLDRVVSSYTANLRALGFARTQRQHAPGGSGVIVAVPDAPGVQPLTGVTREAEVVARLIPDALVLPHPTRSSVLAALPEHQVAHLACHGYADWQFPAMSRLILYDHDSAPLTVADVSGLRVPGGLAYLSACDASVAAPNLTNEALHITSAFQLAGYQHVIGSLWPVNDFLATEMAGEFYRALTSDGTSPPATGRAAVALHRATRQLRKRYPGVPQIWAAHTHTGI